MSHFLDLIAPHYQQLKTYIPGKPIAEIKRSHNLDNISALASNENPLGPSPLAIQTIQSQLQHCHRYPEDAAPQLINELCKMHQIKANQITLGAGSSEILELITRLILNPDTNIIIGEYAFILYRILAQTMNASVQSIPAKKWHHDLSGILENINDKTRLIILDNPNNPTGTWFSHKQLIDFMSKVPSHVIVVVDEAYHEYSEHLKGYNSAISLLNKYNNLLVSRTFSKIHGLAGLRIGYCLGNPDLIELMNSLKKPFSVNNLALLAAHSALIDSNHIQQSITINQTGLNQLCGLLKSHNYEPIGNGGNFICVDFKQPVNDMASSLLKMGCIVRTLLPYKLPNHLRISIGTADEIEHLYSALNKIIKQPKGR